jgi:hypothetical protein
MNLEDRILKKWDLEKPRHLSWDICRCVECIQYRTQLKRIDIAISETKRDVCEVLAKYWGLRKEVVINAYDREVKELEAELKGDGKL